MMAVSESVLVFGEPELAESEFQARQFIHALLSKILVLFGGSVYSQTAFSIDDSLSTGPLDIALICGHVVLVAVETKLKDIKPGLGQILFQLEATAARNKSKSRYCYGLLSTVDKNYIVRRDNHAAGALQKDLTKVQDIEDAVTACATFAEDSFGERKSDASIYHRMEIGLSLRDETSVEKFAKVIFALILQQSAEVLSTGRAAPSYESVKKYSERCQAAFSTLDNFLKGIADVSSQLTTMAAKIKAEHFPAKTADTYVLKMLLA